MIEKVSTVVVGGGQAGLAMSAHLSDRGMPHVILERQRIAERWRTERWDSLVANGPAWHDRFESKVFPDIKPDDFATKAQIIDYFEAFAQQISAPIRCGVAVTDVRAQGGSGFRVETSLGVIEAQNVVAATGPFQRPVIPQVIPERAGILQLHSSAYRNPDQLPEGAVLVVGAGSSGSQIADELRRSGRDVYLSVGKHDRPPRHYRGRDFVWWLGALGKWQEKATQHRVPHRTIAVSGAHGGETVDFRRLAARGITLVGRAQSFADGVVTFAPDLAQNIVRGDKNYLSVLDEADAYIAAHGLDFPEEPGARDIPDDPDSVTNPVLTINLEQAGIRTVIWATGYALDFGWLRVDTFYADGWPRHERGVSIVPGLYFLGLPWLSMRGSSFIWGVWSDAKCLAEHIASKQRAAAE